MSFHGQNNILHVQTHILFLDQWYMFALLVVSSKLYLYVYWLSRRCFPQLSFPRHLLLAHRSTLTVEALFSCTLLLQLLMPVIANNTNHHKWPGVVSRDVMSHVGGLKGEVFTFSGQVKGKTLLPLPPQADAIVKASEQQARLGGMGVTWAKLSDWASSKHHC